MSMRSTLLPLSRPRKTIVLAPSGRTKILGSSVRGVEVPPRPFNTVHCQDGNRLPAASS